MRASRRMLLIIGPLLLIGLCYAVAAPTRSVSLSHADLSTAPAPRQPPDLQANCKKRVRELLARFGDRWHALIHVPYVLAGDLSVSELEQHYLQTILPAHRALRIDYFDHEPQSPVTVLMLATDEQYRQTVGQFAHRRQAEYSGLYAREERTILVNLSTGSGTLAHELTHALAHADFPRMPEWFDEGLASLHEEAVFSDGRPQLVGQHNWRLRFLQEADQRDCWKSVAQLAERRFADPQVAALDYALARYVCLYLQHRGLLSAYYRKCRTTIDQDPTGQLALRDLFPEKTLDEIDGDFRAWIRTQSRSAAN